MPALKLRWNNALVLAKKVKTKSGGALVTGKAVWVKSGGVLVKIWANEHTVTTSPGSLIVQVPNGNNSWNINATVTGGSGPFTYSWAFISGGVGITLANTTTSSVNLSGTFNNQQKTGVLRCSVTDTGSGNLVRTKDVEIDITWGTPI